MSWMNTENECYKYLLSIVPCSYKVVALGGSNSNNPDILILNSDNEEFLRVEIKQPNSQAAQFVVLLNELSFYFSSLNKDQTEKENCIPIIEYLNTNFNKFRDVKQNSIIVDCPKKLLTNRVKSYYKNYKKCLYFITKYLDDFIIFNTEHIDKYFDISCNLRRKRSGSQSISVAKETDAKNSIISFIKNNYGSINCSFKRINKKLFLLIDEYIGFLNKAKITSLSNNDDIFYLSKTNINGKYEVRKLSSVNNPNVIFTLSIKDVVPKSEESEFLKLFK